METEKKEPKIKPKEIILNNIDKINEMLFEGKTISDIAPLIGLSYYSLYSYTHYYKYKNISNKLTEKEKDKITSLVNIDDSQTEHVKDSLYKSCFDRVVNYNDCIVDKNGDEHHIVRQLVIPANISAMRFWLINRKSNEWKNENSQLNLTAQDGSVKSINISFNDNNDQPTKERIASIEQGLEANETKKN